VPHHLQSIFALQTERSSQNTAFFVPRLGNTALMQDGEKLQIPSSNLQGNFKFQASKAARHLTGSKMRRTDRGSLSRY
jgi:hypothetical protein